MKKKILLVFATITLSTTLLAYRVTDFERTETIEDRMEARHIRVIDNDQSYLSIKESSSRSIASEKEKEKEVVPEGYQVIEKERSPSSVEKEDDRHIERWHHDR